LVKKQATVNKRSSLRPSIFFQTKHRRTFCFEDGVGRRKFVDDRPDDGHHNDDEVPVLSDFFAESLTERPNKLVRLTLEIRFSQVEYLWAWVEHSKVVS
jgi:hypothetical protein